MSTFADDYREYQQWYNSYQNTPEAWVTYKELQRKAAAFDDLMNVYCFTEGNPNIGMYEDILRDF